MKSRTLTSVYVVLFFVITVKLLIAHCLQDVHYDVRQRWGLGEGRLIKKTLPADRVPRSACEAGAAVQIYFYLTARPTRFRLSPSRMLAEVIFSFLQVNVN